MTNDDVRLARKMLSVEEVLDLIPISRSTLHRLERNGDFPPGRIVGAKGKVWFADEIADWQGGLGLSRVPRFVTRRGTG